jgi:ABC-type phosphate transport system permease subunit
MNESGTVRPRGASTSLAYRKWRDRLVETMLLAAGLVAVFTTIAIVVVLVVESSGILRAVRSRRF